MPNRRLLMRLTVALGLPLSLLGLLLPTPSLALTGQTLKIDNIDQKFCTPYFDFGRTPSTNDGTGYDFYRLILVDSTGQVDGLHNGAPAVSNTPVMDLGTSFPSPGATHPAAAATYLTLYLYDQTTGASNAPNGTLVLQSAPFPLPVGCSAGTGSLPPGSASNPANTVTNYYPPEKRTLAFIRVDTPIYVAPSLKSQTVGTLKAGQTWFVSVKDPTGMFWQVFIGGPGLGWVKASDINVSGGGTLSDGSSAGSGSTGSSSTITRPGIGTVVPGTIIGVVIASHLRIKAAGNINSAAVATANLGERYIVLGRIAGSSWVKVTGPAGSGWVNSYYLFLSAPLRRVPVITG